MFQPYAYLPPHACASLTVQAFETINTINQGGQQPTGERLESLQACASAASIDDEHILPPRGQSNPAREQQAHKDGSHEQRPLPTPLQRVRMLVDSPCSQQMHELDPESLYILQNLIALLAMLGCEVAPHAPYLRSGGHPKQSSHLPIIRLPCPKLSTT